jgi:hypothetical protein
VNNGVLLCQMIFVEQLGLVLNVALFLASIVLGLLPGSIRNRIGVRPDTLVKDLHTVGLELHVLNVKLHIDSVR